jgi:hypothetical protein
MTDLFATGRIVDLIIGLVVLEGVALVAANRLGLPVPNPRVLLPTLASGVLLLLALRAAIADLPWPFIATPLTLSLASHLADLLGRWRQR